MSLKCEKVSKNIFSKVRDAKITSLPSGTSGRRKDVTLAWNEPHGASFIGENVPTEHLMYVLEIDPPLEGQTSKMGLTNNGTKLFF